MCPKLFNNHHSIIAFRETRHFYQSVASQSHHRFATIHLEGYEGHIKLADLTLGGACWRILGVGGE